MARSYGPTCTFCSGSPWRRSPLPWMGESHFAPAPTALYGAIMLAAALAYRLLARAIVAEHGPRSVVASALGKDIKGSIKKESG